MSLFDSTQLALESAAQGASMRQQALTNNLANINTPGYQRQDVDFHSALQAAQASGVDPTTIDYQPQTDPTRVVRADGSGLDVDEEGANLAENSLEYQAIVQVMSSRFDIVRTAIGF
ncbi:MAG TPA: flagellar basal body protein [Conexibacter sp.]|jgi:flagellar basal-body rod protein FlgB